MATQTFPKPIILGRRTILRTGGIGSTIYHKIEEVYELSKAKTVGMPPVPPNMTTKDMIVAAEKLKLSYEYYNFAFCGSQGAGSREYPLTNHLPSNFVILGKSSLINGLRNLRNVKMTPNWKHECFDAAPTGETETTIELNYYESAKGDNAMTYVRFWDVPGCGTINCPMQDYFNERSLYVFDALIVVSAGILGEYELNLINAAGACNRPVIVVLSKSEFKAESKARDNFDTTDLSAAEYEAIVQETINEAKKHMQDTLEQAKSTYKSLNVSKIFLVSAVKYRAFLNSDKEIDGLLSFETCDLLVYMLETAKGKRVT